MMDRRAFLGTIASGLLAAPLAAEGQQVHRIGVLLFSTPDRKSTRLNSSHSQISYAVFCLKKKKNHITDPDFFPFTILVLAVTTDLLTDADEHVRQHLLSASLHQYLNVQNYLPLSLDVRLR